MKKDTLFKALTITPLIYGVPLPILIIVSFITIILSMYISLFFIGVGIATFLFCASCTKDDPLFFSILPKKLLVNSGSVSKKQSYLLFCKKIDFNHSYSYRNITIEDKKKRKLNLKYFVNFEKWIPFSSHIDKNIIINKNGDLVATWLVRGISFETKSDNELDTRKMELDNLIKSFSNENVSIYQNIIRKNIDVQLNGDFSNNWFAQENNKRYLSYIKSLKTKENIIYISLVLKGSNLTEKTNTFLNKIFSKNNKNQASAKLESDLNRMRDLCLRLDAGLSEFGSRRLEIYEKNTEVFSEQLNLYSYLLTGQSKEIALQNTSLSNLMSTDSLFFGDKTIIGRSDLNGDLYLKSIEIKIYSSETAQGIFDFLLNMPFDLVITQSFSSLTSQKAIELIKSRKNQFESAQSEGKSQIVKLDNLIDDLGSDDEVIGEYHFNVMVKSNNLKDVSDNSKKIIQALSNRGFQAQECSFSLKPAFFSQLPSNFKYRTRVVYLKSINFAGLTGLHNYLKGKMKGNAWGDALTIFETRSGQPHYFNLHEETPNRNDLGKELAGNFMIIGGTGSGKTVLASWILEQCMKFASPDSFKKNMPVETKNFKFIYFDKDRAVQMHILALGGKYIILKKGINANLNPFKLENTENNKKFLVSFIKLLCVSDNEKISTFQERDIEIATEQLMSRPVEKRNFGISLFRQFLPQGKTQEEKEVSIYERLHKWSREGNLGWLFDNENDDIDFQNYPVFGIDGTEFLEDSEIFKPLMVYLVHKIRLILNGQRVGVFFDEIQKYAYYEDVDVVIDDLFRVIRKMQGVIGGATQDLLSIEHTKTYKVLLTQTETKIVMPEKDLRPDYFIDKLKFTQKEFDAISSLKKNKREFLIKKTNVDTQVSECVICSLNLACLNENLRILSIGSSERVLADELIAKTQDAKVWIKQLGVMLDENN